jgi:hypothetical protein
MVRHYSAVILGACALVAGGIGVAHAQSRAPAAHPAIVRAHGLALREIATTGSRATA